MYYKECTAAGAVQVIQEILENVENDREALNLINRWMNNQVTTDELLESYEN